MSSEGISEVLEKLTEWSEEDVKANIDSILPTLLSSLSLDDDGEKFQSVQALLLTCLPCMPFIEVEERLLQHAVPVAKQLFSDALEGIHASLEGDYSTQTADLRDKLSTYLEVCLTILKCSEAVLQYVNSKGQVQVQNVRSVPENIANMLLEAFKHCRESKNLYGEILSIVSDLLKDVFRNSHQVQVLFFNVLADNVEFNCYIEDELQLLIEVLELVSSTGEVLFSLDIKSMAVQWKGYTSLTQKYMDFLRTASSLQKPFSVLVSEVERLLGEVVQSPSTDPKATGKCLRVASFLLKIILKLCEQFNEGCLGDSSSCLFHLIHTLYSHTKVSLAKSHVAHSVVEDIQRYIVVAADPLLGVLFKDSSFRFEFFSWCSKDPDLETENENERVSISLLIAILNQLLHQESAVRFDWMSKEESFNIFAAVFSSIKKYGHEDFSKDVGIKMVTEQNSNPRNVDLYGALVTYAGALIVSAQAEEVESIENVLIKNILQPYPWPALLACDLWVILARTGPSKMCLEQVIFLSDIFTSMLNVSLNVRPEKYYLCALLKRLVPLLSTQDKTAFAERFPPKLHSQLWRVIGLKCCPEKNKSSAAREMSSSAQDSITQFLKSGRITEMMQGLDSACASLEDDPQLIYAGPLSSLWNRLPSDESVLSPWLSTVETRDSASCWLEEFLGSLCRVTSYSILNMNNHQIFQILQRLRTALPCTSSVVKLNMLSILRSLASKFFDPTPDQSKVCSQVSNLFADLLQDCNPIVSYATLETLSYFAHRTKHEKIFVDTVSRNEKLKQTVTNYFQKTLPSNTCSSPEDAKLKFTHRCVSKEPPNTINVVLDPPAKKCKFDEDIDFNFDDTDFLGSEAFFEEELHGSVKKLTESCGEIVAYAAANSIPENTVNKIKAVISDLQKVIENKN